MRWALGCALLAICAGLTLGCGAKGEVDKQSSDDDDLQSDAGGADAGGSDAPDCVSARTVFADEVWTPVFARICLQCHSPDGVATAQNAMLQLLPPSYPGFLDSNFESVSLVARYAFDGKSILLRKPLGEMDHGGGMRFAEDSEEYAALERLVSMLEAEETCDDAVLPPAFDDVELLDANGTFRKATLQLAGRLPTSEEREQLGAEGEAALASLLDGLLRERAFLERLRDIYNDVLLTDLYMRYNGFAVNLLNEEDYPRAVDAEYDALEESLREQINRAIAREPLDLIAYVVEQDRPFSEILTADYTVVSPYSAMIYDVETTFSDSDNANTRAEAQVRIARPDGRLNLPHAGLLTTPAFLNRFPTTPTNRNRHRARKVLELFLATDILKVAERPIDPTASGRYNNPTRDDPQCNGCHRQLDPVAGAFLKWNEYDQERLEPDSEWHPEMFPPGFGKEVMDTSEYANAEQWIAARIVKDPRFVLATLHTLYRGITGHKPLEYPPDPDAADFEPQRAAWQAQDATFRAIGAAFVGDDLNLKTLVRELLLSPYFRAKNASEDLSADRAQALADVGTGRLIIPSVLARKIEAVVGFAWKRGWDSRDLLTSDYNVLYGGIDSDSVTVRLTTPNGVMANVALRMANEVACESTARDFWLPVEQRHLFPGVEPSDVPETETGDAVPAAQERIRNAIRHLHAHVLGEELAADDPELERTYGLFYETWKEGRDKIAAEMLNGSLSWQCQARLDPETGEELPEDQRLSNDEHYTIRAWMAVVTYLLSDHGFLYE